MKDKENRQPSESDNEEIELDDSRHGVNLVDKCNPSRCTKTELTDLSTTCVFTILDSRYRWQQRSSVPPSGRSGEKNLRAAASPWQSRARHCPACSFFPHSTLVANAAFPVTIPNCRVIRSSLRITPFILGNLGRRHRERGLRHRHDPIVIESADLAAFPIVSLEKLACARCIPTSGDASRPFVSALLSPSRRDDAQFPGSPTP